MLSPFLGGLTLDQALQDRRLFYVDLAILQGVETIDGREVSGVGRSAV